jgi:UDP-N-acetylglucosamine 4,6-dehydratase
MLDNKSVLITGGTGSFGKAFIRSVLERYSPIRLVVFSRDELKQFEMQQYFKDKCMRYFIGDIRDESRISNAVEGVDIIIHAAALKQVPALEYNPMEAVKTNILGTKNVVEAATKHNIEKVICLSTDKATSPINLYGATKLTADKLTIAANNIRGDRRTKFSVVRYGNVIGSRGSVIPFFQNLIDNGAKELPITDLKMTRFLITLQQGVNFVLSSLEAMQGGETFVPKIPSATVETVAKTLAPDLPYKIIGIRPGEKLHEVMCPADLSHETIEFESYFVIKPSFELNRRYNYFINDKSEVGKEVSLGFEYSSNNNSDFLDTDSLRKLINNTKLC